MNSLVFALLVSSLWWQSLAATQLVNKHKFPKYAEKDLPGKRATDFTQCLGVCKCSKSSATVDCSDVGLSKVPPFIPCQTEVLHLNGNSIEEIKRSDFRCMTSLLVLNLEENSIERIDEDRFEDLNNLKVLNLRNNRISQVAVSAFIHVNKTLEELDLSKNLWTLSEDMPFREPMGKLRKLTLSENEIQTLWERSFTGLTGLKILDLEINLISSLSTNGFALEGLSSLEELYLGRNFFSRIPQQEAFQSFQESLKTLSFYGHFRVNAISPLFFPNLRTLDLSSCSLSTLANDTFLGCPSIDTLDLSGNHLQLLPSQSFNGLSMLNRLHLSNNNFVTLPYRALANVSASLQYLHADYLSLFRIGSLPEVVDETFLRNLTYLSLEYNGISSIDENSFFKNLIKLQTLKLSNTQLTDVPHKALASLTSLDELIFNGNLVTKLSSESFPSLPSLQHLQINSSSVLSAIEDGAFVGLDNLKSLNLRENNLENVSMEAFAELRHLANLDLTNNHLATGFPEWAQDKTLNELKLAGNRWNCDCTVTRFQQWLRSDNYRDIPDVDDVTCFLPRPLRYKPLVAIDDQDITCDFSLCPAVCICSNHVAQTPGSEANSSNVDCSFTELTDVPANLPHDAAQLSINNNQIKQISESDLSNLMLLESLMLSNNQIEQISSETFRDLHQLTELYLDHNKLQVVQTSWFYNLSRLHTLRIDSNWIQNLGSRSFQNLSQLVFLDASRNNLAALNQLTFSGLQSLKRLVLDENAISKIDSNAFLDLVALQALYLGSNIISSLPSTIFANLTSLTILDLSGNKIVSIGQNFLLSSSLFYLSLEKNQITGIDNCAFAELASLQTLRMAENKVSSVSDNAFKLNCQSEEGEESQITTLDLGWNSLSFVPIFALQPLNNLQTLLLNNNPISDLRSPGGNISQPFLSRLETLYLSGTLLQNVTGDSFLGEVPNLRMLVMNGCLLTEIPTEALSKLSALQSLILDENPISLLSLDSFPYNHKMTQLSLRFSGTLTSISSRTFTTLPNLENLQLSGGSLSYIAPDAFANLTKLEVLDISGNSLVLPDFHWFEDAGASKLQSVSTYDNDWICNCSVIDYKNWILDNSLGLPERTFSLTCHEPVYLTGMNLEDVDDKFLCYSDRLTTPTSESDVTSTAPAEVTSTDSQDIKTTTSGADTQRADTEIYKFVVLSVLASKWRILFID